MTKRRWIKRDGMWTSFDPVIRRKLLRIKRDEIIAGIHERFAALMARRAEAN